MTPSRDDAAAEYDVALARTSLSVGVGRKCADEQISDAVAVHIAGSAHRHARVVTGIDALEDEARAPIAPSLRKQTAQLEGRRKARSTPEHHIALARRILPIGVGTVSADEQIINPV